MELLLDSFERRRTVKCLLFICIFAVHIQADCPRPQGTVNIVLTNDALLKNDFPDGSEATFECANGYVVEEGSGVVTCNDGKWSAPALKCKKKDCGPPKPQPHMIFKMDEGTLFGASVKVSCDEGFEVSGYNYKQCFAGGWSGKATCEGIICEIPTDIAHGRHSWDSKEEPTYGDVIQYSCDAGYTLVGQSFIKCSDEGEYDSTPPQCQGNIEPSTKDIITTTRMMSTTPTTFQGGKDILTKGTTDPPPTTTDTSVTPTIHTDKTTTTTAISTASPSVQGGKHILTTDVIFTTTGATSATTTQGKILPDQSSGHAVVIASVISTVIVVLILLGMFHRYLLRKKGRPQVQGWNSRVSMNSSQQTPSSYDTGEDLKPELLQFQSL